LRLSALIAVELRRELDGEEQEEREDDAPTVPSSSAPRSSSEVPEAACPTREWYALLTGLITRAVLEGYLIKGWRGTTAVEILFGIGLGVQERETADHHLGDVGKGHHGSGSRSRVSSQGRHHGGTGSLSYTSPSTPPSLHSDDDSEDDESTGEEDDLEYLSFEPEEMPTLLEAGKILFPRAGSHSSLMGWSQQTRGDPELEYVREMEERMSEFLNVPAHHSSVRSHLEELSNQYPPEPVERAALRFCEAIARWRGMPELETCKARRVSNRSISMSNSGPPISVRSVPDGDDLGATAIIDRYFTCLRGSPKRSLKRGRSESWGQGEGASKAPKTESSY